MMKNLKLITVVFVAALGSACQSNSGGDTKLAATNADVSSVKTDDDRICRFEKVTGSNIGKRVCRTKEEIARDEEKAKQAMSQMRNKPSPAWVLDPAG
jgi:hypothetical protein